MRGPRIGAQGAFDGPRFFAGVDPQHVLGYGHLLDGNLHLNVVAAEGSQEDAAISSALEPHIYEFVVGKGGSISAEHGIGQLKLDFLPMQKGDAELSLMRTLKHAMDPHGILNPGKVI